MTENMNEIAPEEREAESDDGEITFEQIMYLGRQSMLRNYPEP